MLAPSSCWCWSIYAIITLFVTILMLPHSFSLTQWRSKFRYGGHTSARTHMFWFWKSETHFLKILAPSSYWHCSWVGQWFPPFSAIKLGWALYNVLCTRKVFIYLKSEASKHYVFSSASLVFVLILCRYEFKARSREGFSCGSTIHLIVKRNW